MLTLIGVIYTYSTTLTGTCKVRQNPITSDSDNPSVDREPHLSVVLGHPLMPSTATGI